MKSGRIRLGKSRARGGSGELHSLVPDTENQRGRMWYVTVSGVALVAGVLGALLWLAQLSPFDLPEEEVAMQETTTPTAIATDSPIDELSVATATAYQALQDRMARAVSLQAAANQELPTPTQTPLPPLDRIEGVVALGGAQLWHSDTGLLLATLPHGMLLDVTARSIDAQWLKVETDSGDRGWASSEDVILFDSSRLAAQSVVIIPITPTPVISGVASASTISLTPSITAADGQVLRPTPHVINMPTAMVNLDDSRLNIRAGPGPTYRVIAKGQPGEMFVLTGRNSTGTWLQISLPDLPVGIGWTAAEYLDAAVAVDTLPVVDEISDAPTYVDGVKAGGSEGTVGGDATGMAPLPMIPAVYASAPPPRGRPYPGAGLHGTLLIQKEWGGDIYVYRFDSGELRLLTGGFDPAISPDGQTVAFTRAGGEHGLYLIDIDGRNERLIFNGRELLRSPKWSPDGGWIVFERGDQFVECKPSAFRCQGEHTPTEEFPLGIERQPQLARVDIHGQNYRDLPALPVARRPDWTMGGIVYESPAGVQLTKDEPDFAKSELVFFNIKKQYELDPDFRPDGSRVIFQRRELSHWEIYSVNTDGSDLRALTRPTFTLVDELPSNVAPAWSPDGSHIVFLSNRHPDRSAGPWNVWVMDAEGGNQRPLSIEIDFTYTFVSEQMLDWGR